jgi:GNAT superfamily N-acetyltransferase
MAMIEISTARERLDIGLIHAFLSEESHWARGIARELVERSLANSLCFGAYEDGWQLGLARVVTDHATFAWLADVFVVAPARGRGIAAMLMEAVVAHPYLQGLRRIVLATSSAPALYARYGFAALAKPEIWMERSAPNAHSPPA